MNIIKKILLYLSAFVPLYLLLIIKIVIQLLNKNISINVLNTLMLCVLCLFVGLGILGVVLTINVGEKTKVKILSFTNLTEKHFLGYFSLFVLFALTFDIQYISYAVIFVLIILLIGIVYIKNNLFYINPLLNIIGYSFYEVEYTINNTIKTTTLFYSGKLEKEKSYTLKITECNFNNIIE